MPRSCAASGDKSGGGKQGGGQGANQAGNDSAGSNNVADEGSGAAQQPGSGETSAEAGDKQTAEGQTANAEDSTRGSGSTTQRSDTGDKASSQPGAADTGNRSPLGGSSGTASNPASTSGFETKLPPEQEANLQYARKATDLALEHLKDQQDNPDPRLLEKLGWTKDELQSFLDRWESLNRNASDDPLGQRELDESLRSLGLRPTQDKRRSGNVASDTAQGTAQSAGQP